MYSNVVVIEGKFLPPELFDIDREDITMNSKVEARIEAAKRAGYKVEPVTLPNGAARVALKDADGKTVQTGRTELDAWQHAFNNNRLPAASPDTEAQESGHDRKRKNPAG